MVGFCCTSTIKSCNIDSGRPKLHPWWPRHNLVQLFDVLPCPVLALVTQVCVSRECLLYMAPRGRFSLTAGNNFVVFVLGVGIFSFPCTRLPWYDELHFCLIYMNCFIRYAKLVAVYRFAILIY